MSRSQWAVALLTLLWSSVASACPYCAGKDPTSSGIYLALMAFMIFLPFVVAGIVWPIIKRTAREEEQLLEHHTYPTFKGEDFS